MKRIVFLLAPIALALGFVLTANAADHRDSPSIEGDPSADITDVYAFRSTDNPESLVVALGVNGLTPPAESRNFGLDVTYNIHVDNTGDLVADATASITFSGSEFTISGLGDPITGDVTPYGAAAPVVNESGGIKAFAGPRDDAFFFDLTGFQNFLADPQAPATGLRPAGQTPVDAFADTNVSAIVLELPITALTGADDASSGTIRTWASTVRGDEQVDRMAIPAINTALIPSGVKDAFNKADPGDDAANYRATAQATIEGLRSVVDALFGTPQDGGPLGDLTPEQVATALIPDVVTIDFSQPVQFPNGRQLQDDVIDAALGVVLNRGGSAGIGDAIDGNDVAFSSSFPYLAAPHARDVMPGVPSTGTGGDSSNGTNYLAWALTGMAIIALAAFGGRVAMRIRS